jgi:hypothetical protein
VANAEEDQLAAVIRAWNDRQNRVQSFHFSWSGKHFASKERAEGFRSDHSRRVSPKGDTIVNKEPSDVSFDIQMDFSLDEKKGRFRTDYQAKATEEFQAVPQTSVVIHDGQIGKTFFPKSSGTPFPLAAISNNSPLLHTCDLRSLPISLAYRPFDGVIAGVFDRAKLTLTTEEGVVEGRDCIILRENDGESDTVKTVWVDPARDFIPVRYLTSRNGHTDTQVEVSYVKDASLGWVPNAWTIRWLNEQGGTNESWSATKVTYEINTPIPDSTFDVSYPVGTWVNNCVTDERYLLLENGKKRPILPGEFNGENYEDLLHSEPGSQLKKDEK